MTKRKQSTPPMARSEEFIEVQNIENVTFVDDSDLLCVETDPPNEENEADQTRLFYRLQNPKFIAWLKAKGYDRNKATSQLVNEFDEMGTADIRKRPAKSPPPPIVEIVDPARIPEAEWNAGAAEWTHEGHEDLVSIPLERPQWEALLRRRRARLEADKAKRLEVEFERRRQRAIASLAPPKLSDVVLDGKSVVDAQKAYQQGEDDLSALWAAKFSELPNEVMEAWRLYHNNVGRFVETTALLRPRKPTKSDFQQVDFNAIKDGLAHPGYKTFQRYSAAILQHLEQLNINVENALHPPADSRPSLKGWSLDEIDENDGSAWTVPGVIPHGLTFVYGLPKSGKSLWMQKLSACIAGGVPFDGIEGLTHGRVLYITRDIGASRQEVKKRLLKIMPHLGLSENALDGKLIITDDPFYLNDTASVDNLLAQNSGIFALVVIDSLFRCVTGSLSQDVVASAAVEGIDRISRATGAAVVAIHHEPRGGEHLFGSVALDAAYDAKVHVERGKDRNSVIVTVQELKNAPVPAKPFLYRLEGECLEPVANAGATPATTAKSASSRHQDMLALLPMGWFTRKDGRKLVDHLLTGGPEARRKHWQRAVAAMQGDGMVEVKRNSVMKT